MRDLIKRAFFILWDLMGKNREAFRKKWPSVTILTYHSVLPDTVDMEAYENRNAVSVSEFDRQLKWLKSVFKVISLKEAHRVLTSGDLQENYAVITFDDGYRNNFEYAWPVLQKNDLPAAFFVTTALVGSNDCLWTDWVNYLLFRTAQKAVTLEFKERKFHFTLQSEKEKIRASSALRKYMKTLKRQQADQLLQQLKAKTEVFTHPVQEAPHRYAFMDWPQIKQMADRGMDIGSHTHTHSLLSMLTLQSVEQELKRSKALIEEHTHQPCTFFAYPNGQPGDFTGEHIEVMRSLGFALALTQIPGYNQSGDDLYRLRRINITSKMHLPVFKAYVCGSKKSKYHNAY